MIIFLLLLNLLCSVACFAESNSVEPAAPCDHSILGPLPAECYECRSITDLGDKDVSGTSAKALDPGKTESLPESQPE